MTAADELKKAGLTEKEINDLWNGTVSLAQGEAAQYERIVRTFLGAIKLDQEVSDLATKVAHELLKGRVWASDFDRDDSSYAELARAMECDMETAKKAIQNLRKKKYFSIHPAPDDPDSFTFFPEWESRLWLVSALVNNARKLRNTYDATIETEENF